MRKDEQYAQAIRRMQLSWAQLLGCNNLRPRVRGRGRRRRKAVCVCERERETEREKEGGAGREAACSPKEEPSKL